MMLAPRVALQPEALLRWLMFAVVFAGIAVFCVAVGFWTAVLPASFLIKASFPFIGAVVLLVGLLAGRSHEATTGDGARLRVVLLCWVFLIGACPAYLPFKFGPLPGLNPLRIAFFLMVGLWAYLLVASTPIRRRLFERLAAAPKLVGLFFAYLVWQLMSAVLADEVLLGLNSWIRGLSPLLVALVVLSVVRDWRDVVHLVYALCVGALVACGVGLLEWQMGSNPFLPFFPKDAEQLAALQWIAMDKSRGGAYRVAATFSHPLALGEFLSMCLPLAGALVMAGTNRLQRLVGLAVVVASLPVIYLTFTRSSMVAAGVSVILFGALVAIRAANNRKHLGTALLGWMSIVVALVGGIAVLGSALELAQGRTVEERGSSMARVEMFNRAVNALSERPLQGYGPGMGAITAGIFAPGAAAPTIDSHYLSVVVEHGLPGLALYLTVLASVVLVAVRGSLRGTGPARWLLPAVTVALMSSLTVKLVLSLTNNIELFYVLMALAIVGSQWAKSERVQSSTPSGPL